MFKIVLACFAVVLFFVPASLVAENFLVGTGIYDVTGPAAEIGMMGYARMDQTTKGIHTRLWSRAFVIESKGNRIAYVNADLWAIPQAVKLAVVKKLQKRYGNIYNVKNVMLCGTHTHSGPGGYSHYTLYNITILGFCEQNFNAIVEGLYQSIVKAHNNVAPARIFLAEGSVDNTSINRSLEAYQANVDANLYPPTDNSVTVLRFERLDGKEFGMISWFAVHTTSMFYGHDKSFENPNGMISSDNKGWSELKFEKAKGTDYWGEEETFIASFSNSTLGDVSPNVLGGQEGGGINDFASTHISGDKQFQKTWELYHDARRELSPNVNFRHTFKDYSKVTVSPEYTDGQEHKTSYAAIGLAFAAGAEDGPSKIPYIKEGLYKGKYHESHGLKPIFLETGKMEPYPWTPEVLSIQIFTIGNLALLAVPGEFTTHCGRRIKQTIASDMEQMGVDTMLICGPANAYAGYVATREEYNEQHYEGASTHFGQWTLGAFRQEFKALSSSLVNGTIPEDGPQPRDLTGKQSSLQPEVVFDAPALGMEFGDLHKDAPKTVERLSVLEVIFCGAHPNNTLKTNDSFLQVERKTEDGWKAVRYDYDVDTAFSWERHGIAASKIKILWDIQENVPGGTYRIKHSGKYKGAFSDKRIPYSGYTREFQVVPSQKLEISSCQMKGQTINFQFHYPKPTFNVLGQRTEIVSQGQIRFQLNGKGKEFIATPGKGGFVATLPKNEPVTTVTVPAGWAQDEQGNANKKFSIDMR